MTDLFHIAPRHGQIDARLSEWARWVKVHPRLIAMQPMWRYAKSNARQWEVDPPIHIEINTMAAMETEKAVAALPEKNREAIRWCYVWPYIPLYVIRRQLGLTKDALAQVIDDGRDILENRLRVNT